MTLCTLFRIAVAALVAWRCVVPTTVLAQSPAASSAVLVASVLDAVTDRPVIGADIAIEE